MDILKTNTRFAVVYNLTAFGEDLYLPDAFIVSLDREGYFAHIQQKALVSTIGSFNLELDPVREQLFELIQELQPKELERQFQPNKRKKITLDGLLAQEEIKKVIHYHYQVMVKF